MLYTYLDWNVFDRIEKKDTLDKDEYNIYSKFDEFIRNNKIICPYSNAHINDLLRGYNNDPSYTRKHLETIKRLTNNLCIVQYWGNSITTWHYRDINEFFTSALSEIDLTSMSFIEFWGEDETVDIFRSLTIPSEFKKIYKANPIFNRIFPKTKAHLNFFALCEDFYDLSNIIKKDNTIYKFLRNYVNQSYGKLRNHRDFLRKIDKLINDGPKHLDFYEEWEKYSPKNITSNNPAFQRITDTYLKIDFKGFKSDEKFSNMIDDSLHVFYGANCDYFITIDDKCHYKATETYDKLGIETKAMKPDKFIDIMI